ncbi:MAG: hypothetical protein N4J56_007731 [Chroococcidiopsis sp. SAG 2025]|uniref:DUF1822 family protein n=1 Tax=Chroococcidiopsis sp. SAG 2025 TaxID=171389 RepID=UPI0029372413|nr:DUF1822 family protein [Chroococcidiopsis sp. SAG 2025]MDV2998026.1 hypothetical protein [Chroococcidiopsis sp. SAG 2025]
MISGTNEPTGLTICVPISAEDRVQAQAFARQQLSSDKAQRVYWNTLAVLAMNIYLQWQQFTTDLSAGDSWSPMNLIYDAADLMIVGLGKVECHPILNLDAPLPIPAEIWYDRVAYIAVHLNQSATQARLLGFLPLSEPENVRREVPPCELQSMDDLMDYFERLELGQQVLLETIAESEQLQQRWSNPYEQLMVVAQLERIYRIEQNHRLWRVKGERLLSGSDSKASVRREINSLTERIELQDIAERLLKRLAEVWERQVA